MAVRTTASAQKFITVFNQAKPDDIAGQFYARLFLAHFFHGLFNNKTQWLIQT